VKCCVKFIKQRIIVQLQLYGIIIIIIIGVNRLHLLLKYITSSSDKQQGNKSVLNEEFYELRCAMVSVTKKEIRAINYYIVRKSDIALSHPEPFTFKITIRQNKYKQAALGKNPKYTLNYVGKL
jgi:hypothetical protein